MSNLNNYPVQINGTNLPVATMWNENSETVENAYTTEAGTDVVDVMRYDKLTVNASYDVSSTWLKTFKDWSTSSSKLTVKIYDPSTNGYVTRYMRIRNFVSNLLQHSDRTADTIGLWTITFDLIEF